MFYTPSPIDTLLDTLQKEGSEAQVDLEQFLDEFDLLGELRATNKRLVDYLSTRENLKNLVGYTVGREELYVKHALDEEKKKKYAFIAGEVLASRTCQISSLLVADEDLVRELFGVLEDTPAGQLGPTQAANVCKIFVSLLRGENAQFLAFAQKKDGFIDKLINHVRVGPVADFMVRLLDGPENDQEVLPPKTEVTQLLSNANILNRLADLFVACTLSESMTEEEKETSILNIASTIMGFALRALELAKLFIMIPSSLNPYSNTRAISRMILAGIQDFNLSSTGGSNALVLALGIASEMLTTEANEIAVQNEISGRQAGRALTSMVSMSQARNTGLGSRGAMHKEGKSPAQGVTRKPVVSTKALEVEMQDCFKPLVSALTARGPKRAIENTVGRIEEPLGLTRLKIIEFFIACLKQGSTETITALDDVDVPETLLQLFFKYEWNNMLHHMVTSAVVHALESEEETAQTAWLRDDFITRIIAKWNEEFIQAHEAINGHIRAGGHLGHIIILAMALDSFFNKNQDRKDIFASKEELHLFEDYCANYLEEAREKQTQMLGGARPGASDRSDASDVVEENTDVVEVEAIFKDLAMRNSQQNRADDSDEDEVEVEVVDTSLPAEDLSEVVEANQDNNGGQNSSDDEEWVAFEPDTVEEKDSPEKPQTATSPSVVNT